MVLFYSKLLRVWCPNIYYMVLYKKLCATIHNNISYFIIVERHQNWNTFQKISCVFLIIIVIILILAYLFYFQYILINIRTSSNRETVGIYNCNSKLSLWVKLRIWVVKFKNIYIIITSTLHNILGWFDLYRQLTKASRRLSHALAIGIDIEGITEVRKAHRPRTHI